MYKMKLNPEPFDEIKKGHKEIEVRLNDKKRQKLSVGDTIEFSKLPELREKIIVEVKKLLPFKTFGKLYDELYDGVDSDYFKKWDKDSFVTACRIFYTKKVEEEYGALGIRIKIM